MKFSLLRSLNVLSVLLLASGQVVLASDYCGEPVARDIYSASKPAPKFVSGAFGDPASMTAGGASFNGGADSPMPGGGDYLRGSIVSIQSGTALEVILDRAISSGTAQVGDLAYGQLASPAQYGLPQGSAVELVVSMVEPARRGFERNGRVAVSARRLLTPQGQAMTLSGKLLDSQQREQMQGGYPGSRVVNSAGKILLGAGSGALAGVSLGAIAGGDRLGVATLVGAGVGAVIGGIWAALKKGENVILPAGMNASVRVGA